MQELTAAELPDCASLHPGYACFHLHPVRPTLTTPRESAPQRTG
jgi:hypothetical protein